MNQFIAARPHIRIFAHGARDNRLNNRRDRRVKLTHRNRLLLQMLHGNAHRGLAIERQLTGQHLIEYHAQRINIRLRRDHRPLGLLWRKIMHGTNHITRIGHRRLGHGPGNAEISNLGTAACHHEDIVRLDVAVNQIIGMSV